MCSSEQKQFVRISPILLGKIGDLAACLTKGSLIVQFAGRRVSFNDGDEWHVTHGVVSNSTNVVGPEERAAHNQQVEKLMHSQSLTHVGWLRQASSGCPLSSLDLETQRVYESHVPDSFAAMLDMSDAEGTAAGPRVFFYCLANRGAPRGDPHFNAFCAAYHIILDSTVPSNVVKFPTQVCEPAPRLTASMLPPSSTRSTTLHDSSKSDGTECMIE